MECAVPGGSDEVLITVIVQRVVARGLEDKTTQFRETLMQ